MMRARAICSKCGAVLPGELIGGLCPRCIAGFYLTASDDADAHSTGSSTATSTNGNLQVIGKIGEGGMGEILAATDLEIGRTVAIKRLKPERRQDTYAKSRFLAEARITGQLEHPGIVPVYEMGIDAEGQDFYAMRRIKGATLDQVLSDLKEQKPAALLQYSLPALLTIFQKACDAVAYAHSRKIIHRDLKPENIMVGEFGEVVVMDWGLAKLFSSNSSEETAHREVMDPIVPNIPAMHKTLDRAVIGSPGFMAPEQAAGRAHESDERTDVFALGAILYAILTLRAPIEGQSPQSMIDRTRFGVIRPPTDFNGGRREEVKRAMRLPQRPTRPVPAALSAVAMKALACKPEERYQSVKELQGEIAAYQNGYATIAEEAGVWTHLRLLIRRRQAEAMLAAGAFAILLVVTTVFVWRVTATLKQLQSTAPSFAAEAHTLIEQGKLVDALEKIRYAEKLAPREPEYRYREGNILQALLRLKEAREAYAAALKISSTHRLAEQNLRLSDDLLRANGPKEALLLESVERLRVSVVEQGRVAEAVLIGNVLGKRAGELLERQRASLLQAGFPGTLKLAADGGLELDASHTIIRNLSPLKGMPLSRLNASFTAISDLTPLREMPLHWLDIQSTPVADLNPIRALRLEDLIISRTRVTNFNDLKGMPLVHLVAQELSVNDLTPLTGMPLRYLNLYRCTNIVELRPLLGMRMGILDLYKSHVTDISPLQDMPLSFLNLDDTLVSDLSPLKGTPITSLNLTTAPVTDLTPLQGLRLTELALTDTPVTDLEPLRDMPLKILLLDGCACLKDIAPLESCRDLEQIILPRTVKNLQILRSLPKLRKLGHSISFSRDWNAVPSAEEFWKTYQGSGEATP